MPVAWLAVESFRNHRSTRLELDPGRTLVVGPNGHGKTNLVEALGMLGGGGSFRGASSDALVRAGCERAFVRAEVGRASGRSHLVEMEIALSGRARVQVDGRRLAATRDLAEVVAAVVFSPADLTLASGGPALRRQFCDEVLGASDREFRRTRADLERIVRQRNNLLRQLARRRPDSEALATLDVWDAQFARAGEAVAKSRAELCAALAPAVSAAYSRLAGAPAELEVTYLAPWRELSLADALAAVRSDDLRRGVSTVGPQRDDVTLTLAGLPARTHASQGEQRSLALALRLAQHRFLSEASAGSPPAARQAIVLLDDVFSELDEGRAGRLVDALPAAQTVITSATGQVPEAVDVQQVVHIRDGAVVAG